MKIELPQASLSRALLTSSKSILPRANLPILSNVLIRAEAGKVEFLTTNLETATRVVLSGKTEISGEVTVNGKTLLEFISQLPNDDVVIEKLGEELVVVAKGFSGRLTTMPAGEFPAIPRVDKGVSLQIDCADFVDAVSKVAFSAAQDEGRPILTGVLCDVAKGKIKMVATDGYRLSFKEVNAAGAQSSGSLRFNVPAKALNEVAKIIIERGLLEPSDEGKEKKGFKLMVSEGLNQISFKFEGPAVEGEPRPEGWEEVEFTSRLIEGEFPNWQKIIPGTFNTKAKVAKEEFIKLVRVASIFARDAGNIIKLKFEPGASEAGKAGKFSVSATSAQTGSSDAAGDVEINGPGGEIAFNFRYLLEVLAVTSDEEVFFEMNESLNPGRITGADSKDSFFHIIMPVRLQA